jgi:hypothetical protein
MQPPVPPTLPPDPADWLDLYLDGLLQGPDLARFQREVENNPRLRQALDLQHQIDSSLKAGLPYVEPVPIAGRIASQPTARPLSLVGMFNKYRLHAAAAVLALSAALFALYMNLPASPEIRYVEPAAVYARLQSAGFVPEFVCSTDAEFIAAVQKRLGSGLLVSSTAGLEVLGWAYGNDYSGRIIGPDTLVLMCRVDGKDDVVVLMDRTHDDRRLALPPTSSLHLFRREVGPLVLYEITPRTDQSVLPKAQLARSEGG